ncbi:MAG: hypothetical protein JXR26_05605 [Balneolaceae bacterium]|nr:hypothetical protein [Balneolaceae bacterium]
MRRYYIFAISLWLFSFFYLGCDKTSFVALKTSSGTIKSGILKENPPDTATKTVTLDSITSDQMFRSLSISPGGAYIAVSVLDRLNGSPPFEVTVTLYNPITGDVYKTYDKSDIKSMIENNSDGEYPPQYYFDVFLLGWNSDQELIMNLQPGGGELLAQNVGFAVDVRTDQVTINPVFKDRSIQEPVPIPNHPEKTRFNYTLNNGDLIVEGNTVRNLPSSIDLVDMVYMGNE